MAKVLQVDATSADAWVEKNLGSNQSSVWIKFDLRFDAAALAGWQAMGQFSGNFVEVLADDDADQLETLTINTDGWYDYYAGTIASPSPAADAWVTVEIHRAALDTVAVYFNGSLDATSADTDANDTRFIRFGQSSSMSLPDAICYIRNVKVGTTRGGTQLFSDDFSSGALGNWTTLEGDVGVVTDPFVTVFNGAATIALTFGMEAAGSSFSLFPAPSGGLTLTPAAIETLTLAAA